jgi:beta-lactamase regulating signal transducer with metallopeptidase domain
MSLSDWARLLAWLVIETSALVVCAALIASRLQSPQVGRTVWRATLTAVALVWIVELSGLRQRIPGKDARHSHFVLTAMVIPPSTSDTKTNNRTGEAAVMPVPALGRSSAKWPGWLWLGGSLFLLGRFCVARLWLSSRRRASAPADENSLGLIAHWQTAFGLRGVTSQVWPSLRSPVAFGIFRPTIALPPDFLVRFSVAEREAMLAHEMAHLAARDPLWLAVSDAVIDLAWWHPLVWWARRKLQFANEAAADEASVLIPDGARALAECLVRLGREMDTSGPVRALGVGGTGLRSQLAGRIERLLRGPTNWRPPSVWLRWGPPVSAVFVALASAVLPIQTGITGSILAVLATAAPVRAENPPAVPAPATVTNQVSTYASAKATINVTATGNALSYHWVFNGSNAAGPARTTNPADASNSSPASVTKSEKAPGVFAANSAEADMASPAPVVSAQPAQTGHANPRRKLSLMVQATILAENDSDSIGLDWVFGRAPTDNPALEITDDGKALQASPPIHGKMLAIDHYHTHGQSAVLKPAQFSALFDRIGRQADILTAPVCVTASGLKARIAIQKIQETVTDVEADAGSAAKSASVNYITDKIDLGLAVSVIPTYEEAGRWSLRVTASETAFIGYDKSGKDLASVSATGGKPIKYQIPHPHFRAVVADAEDSLLPGQTLALRGPLWTETTKTKGHFLVRGKTKTVRQRLYVFVTPTSLPYSATRE